MPDAKQVWEYITEFAPAELAEEWDNVGPLVQSGGDTAKILVCLDITPGVVQEAAQKGCGMVVSHHPVIFSPLRSLQQSDVVYQLVRAGISAVCAHTNLDAADGGVNDVLAARFGLLEVESFAGLGRVGFLPAPLPAESFAAQCAHKLSAPVQLADCGRTVRRLAVVGGSGGDYLAQAKEAGADMLLTGEAGHHAGLDALQAGISLAVAGHYATEFPVVPVLAQKLAARFAGTEVLVAQNSGDPFSFIAP